MSTADSSIPMNKKNAMFGVRIQKGQREKSVEWRVSMASRHIPDTWATQIIKNVFLLSCDLFNDTVNSERLFSVER